MGVPDVSVITSTYNSEDYVERALESIRNQTIDKGRIEHIVVDDASTDSTRDIVNGFDAPYLKFVNKSTNTGATSTLNRGIEEASGEYVVALDSDDEFKPRLLEEMLDVFESHAEADFVYCDYYERYPDGEQVYVDTKSEILNTITIGVMHRRETLLEFGKYDPQMYFSEYDLLLRYIDSGIEGVHISRPLFVYYRRSDSQTGDKEWVRRGKKELKNKYGDDVEIRDY